MAPCFCYSIYGLTTPFNNSILAINQKKKNLRSRIMYYEKYVKHKNYIEKPYSKINNWKKKFMSFFLI